MQPTISLIAIISENRAIGNENRLLWQIPEDMKRFRITTKGHPVIMGRKTHESIGHPLPDRTNIIITRNSTYTANGCLVSHSLDEALTQAAKSPGSEEIFVIGGGQIYAQAMPLALKLYITVVKGNFAGDTYFPDYSRFKTIVSEEKRHDRNYDYSFFTLVP